MLVAGLNSCEVRSCSLLRKYYVKQLKFSAVPIFGPCNFILEESIFPVSFFMKVPASFCFLPPLVRKKLKNVINVPRIFSHPYVYTFYYHII